MKPNWSAASALLRALLILFASTFAGALVLPLAADGTLPTDWAHWRPVLATAFAAAMVAELAYVRAHLAQAAQALGISPAGAVAAATKAAGAALLLLVLGACAGCGLTGGQVVQDVTIGLNAAACVLNTVSAETAAGKTEEQAVADAVVKCGVSAAQAAGVLDAHRKAEVTEGFVLKPAASK